MEFYNVKKKAKVQIADKDCKVQVYKVGNQERYALRAQDDDGINLTRFVTKEVYDKFASTSKKCGCCKGKKK